MAFKFEKLEVWKESVELAGLIHDISLKFPCEVIDCIYLAKGEKNYL